MASPGSATAADVPGVYDVVINGFGYVLGDSVQSSLPFRTHRAIYDFSPPFVERQNVSNQYGDNTQDFFLTVVQNDWSLGEQQRFFRAGNADSVRRYWKGTNVNPVFLDGRIFPRPAVTAFSPGATIATCAPSIDSTSVVSFSSTTLYSMTANTNTSEGAHGLGRAPDQFGVCTDGDSVYFSANAATSVRAWDGASFSSFSTQQAQALCFVDNTLWGAYGSTIYSYDTSGTATAQSTLKGAAGSTTTTGSIIKILPFGGQVIMLTKPFTSAAPGSLWVGDTNGFNQIAQFDAGFTPLDMAINQGIVFVAGYQGDFQSPLMTSQPVVNYYANGNIGRLWQSKLGNGGQFIAIAPFDQGLVIADGSSNTVVYYNASGGGVSTMFSFTNGGASPYTLATGSNQILLTFNGTSMYGMTAGAAASQATVQSSLFDFDSTLVKVFRGVRVDWEDVSNSGGTVDIVYQVDTLDSTDTTLKTGATSGVEYPFPADTTGTAVSVTVKLNKGTSTYGPALKRLSIRAAPQLPQYKSATYLLDCTGSANAPRMLRDGTYHPLSGYEQVLNLRTAAQSMTPISITDKVNGTFTGFIDLNNAEGWDVYEVHPTVDDPNNPGSFFVRLTVREV